jgi:hypothetical protein
MLDLNEEGREVDLDDLVELEADFYGISGQCFKLDDICYEVIDEDGERFLKVVSANERGKRFFRSPIARVIVEHEQTGDEDVYRLVDTHDGYFWLTFGTVGLLEAFTEFVFEARSA